MAYRPTFSDLPLELCDQIVDCLIGDNESLRSLSLVHSSLRPRAQMILLQRIKLDTMRDASRFGYVIEKNPTISTYITDLTTTQHNLFPTENPSGLNIYLLRVLFLIQENGAHQNFFTLAFDQSKKRQQLPRASQLVDMDESECLSGYQFQCLSFVNAITVKGIKGFPYSILYCSTRLSDINLVNVSFYPSWTKISLGMRDYMSLGVCQFVRKLHLDNVSDFPRDFISSCANLTDFKLSDCPLVDFGISKGQVYYPAPCHSRPKIKSLRVHYRKEGIRLAALITEMFDLSELREFCETEHVLVDLCKHTITHLELPFVAPANFLMADLSTFPKLETVIFLCFTGTEDSSYPDKAIPKYVKAVLDTLPTERLGRVEVVYSKGDSSNAPAYISQLPEWDSIFKLASVHNKPNHLRVAENTILASICIMHKYLSS